MFMLLSFWTEYQSFFLILIGAILVIIIFYIIYSRPTKEIITEDTNKPIEAKTPVIDDIVEDSTETEIVNDESIPTIITHISGNRQEEDAEDEIDSNLDEYELENQEKLRKQKVADKKASDTANFNQENLKFQKSKRSFYSYEDDEDELVNMKANWEKAFEMDGTNHESKRYHVLYLKEENKWYVKREGAEAVINVLETQKEAIAFATIKAINQGTSVVVHKRDGKIRKHSL